MKPKAVIPRERAERDVDEAIEYYLSEKAPEAALGFIDALEQAYRHIGRQPDAGSSRYVGELNVTVHVENQVRILFQTPAAQAGKVQLTGIT